MGVPELRKIAVLDEVQLNQFKGDTVALDAHHFLYSQMNIVVRYRDEDEYTADDGTELPNLIALLQGIPSLLNAGVEPVFVFDGMADPLKQDEIDRREKLKEQAKEKMEQSLSEGDIEAARKYKAQTQSITEPILNTSKELLDHLGIRYVDATKSGESCAAEMVKSGVVDAVATDDYDSLLFGSPVTVRQYSGSGLAERMVLQDTLDEHNITHKQLVEVALMCGTDYNEGIHGIGPKRGLERIKKYGDIDTVLKYTEGDIPNTDELRSIFLDTDCSVPNISSTTEPNYDLSVAFASDCGIPADLAINQIKRFPDY